MNPFDQVKSASPPGVAEEDGLIDLVEVMEEEDLLELTEEMAPEAADEGAAEVVLDLRGGSDDLDALKALQPSPEKEPPAPPAPPGEESLDDFLASLPELPEDLDTPGAAEPLEAPAVPDLHQELAGRLSEAELQDLVRQVVMETVERLAREMVPQLATEAIERQLTRIKKRLSEPD
jgi:hypothetical protein